MFQTYAQILEARGRIPPLDIPQELRAFLVGCDAILRCVQNFADIVDSGDPFDDHDLQQQLHTVPISLREIKQELLCELQTLRRV